jgi:hypothetical protein
LPVIGPLSLVEPPSMTVSDVPRTSAIRRARRVLPVPGGPTMIMGGTRNGAPVWCDSWAARSTTPTTADPFGISALRARRRAIMVSSATIHLR